MHEWRLQIQDIIDAIDESIESHDDEALTLRALARRLGYSEFHTTRKFREVSGMQLRDYLQGRRLAFALKEVRDSDTSLLDIALAHGFSSHEAFTRAFKRTFGVTPSAYRKDPSPVVLRTKITAFDRSRRASAAQLPGPARISQAKRFWYNRTILEGRRWPA